MICKKSRGKKQGRMRGYPSRVRVGRSSAGEGHYGIWAGAVGSKNSKTPKNRIVAKALDGQRYPRPGRLCLKLREEVGQQPRRGR